MDGTGQRAILVAAAFLAGLGLALWLSGVRAGAPARRPAAGVSAAPAYERIICMSPAVVEIAFAVGAGPRVVGVCQYAKHPPEALERPACGGAFNPNRELILALQADLVITQGEAEDLRAFGRANGIAVESLPITDVASIFGATERLGRLLALEAGAAEAAARMRAGLDAVRARVAGREPVSVLLVVAREPGTLNNVSAVGPGGFLSDVIEAAGGRNAFADLSTQYGLVNAEALLERAPQVIVELRGEGAEPGVEQEVRQLWAALPDLPAVRDGRVHVIESTYAMIPGPRLVLLAERLADIFHGEGR